MIKREELKTIMCFRTNKQAARFLGVSERTVARWIKFYDLTYEEMKHADCPKKFSNLQRDFILGSLLGDGHIDKYGRFKFKMKESSKEYVNWSRLLLKPMSRDLKLEKIFRNGKTNKAVSYCTINYSLFKSLRKLWYNDGVKMIPHGFDLNTNVILHWYLQDGCNIWQKKTIQFATHSFCLKDVEFLVSLLKKRNIESTIQKNRKGQFIINIGAKFYFDFFNLFKRNQLSFNCFAYKFDTSKCKQGLPNFGAGKLNFQKAEQIRFIYQELNCTQKSLAEKFGVTQVTIGKIINNISYKRILNGIKE